MFSNLCLLKNLQNGVRFKVLWFYSVINKSKNKKTKVGGNVVYSLGWNRLFVE